MVDWTKRGYKLLGSFMYGYGSAWSAVFTLDSYKGLHLDFYTIFLFPALIGLGWTWPQLAKVFTELGNQRKAK